MSFKINEEYNGKYKISIGTGKTFKAHNLQEVVFALQHYYREDIPLYPFEWHGTKGHDIGSARCPLCDNK